MAAPALAQRKAFAGPAIDCVTLSILHFANEMAALFQVPVTTTLQRRNPMGLLDSLLKNMQQGGQSGQGGGDLSKSLMDALNSILTDGGQGSQGSQYSQPASQGGGRQQQQAQQEDEYVGGIAAIVEKLQKAGCGDAVKSWIGKGENAPIGPEPIKKALGNNTVRDLSNQSGLPENELLTQLSKMLPSLIDRLTPNGRLPQSWQEVVASLQQTQQLPPQQRQR
jgi:uncharacterized protein YidB (DUF937 family)